MTGLAWDQAQRLLAPEDQDTQILQEAPSYSIENESHPKMSIRRFIRSLQGRSLSTMLELT